MTRSRRQEILEVVRGVIRRELECSVFVEEESDMLTDLQLDSLQRLTLSVEPENRFELCFDPEEEQGLATIGDVLDLIDRELAAGDKEERDAGWP